jgi:hypothetical protein
MSQMGKPRKMETSCFLLSMFDPGHALRHSERGCFACTQRRSAGIRDRESAIMNGESWRIRILSHREHPHRIPKRPVIVLHIMSLLDKREDNHCLSVMGNRDTK